MLIFKTDLDPASALAIARLELQADCFLVHCERQSPYTTLTARRSRPWLTHFIRPHTQQLIVTFEDTGCGTRFWLTSSLYLWYRVALTILAVAAALALERYIHFLVASPPHGASDHALRDMLGFLIVFAFAFHVGQLILGRDDRAIAAVVLRIRQRHGEAGCPASMTRDSLLSPRQRTALVYAALVFVLAGYHMLFKSGAPAGVALLVVVVLCVGFLPFIVLLARVRRHPSAQDRLILAIPSTGTLLGVAGYLAGGSTFLAANHLVPHWREFSGEKLASLSAVLLTAPGLFWALGLIMIVQSVSQVRTVLRLEHDTQENREEARVRQATESPSVLSAVRWGICGVILIPAIAVVAQLTWVAAAMISWAADGASAAAAGIAVYAIASVAHTDPASPITSALAFVLWGFAVGPVLALWSVLLAQFMVTHVQRARAVRAADAVSLAPPELVSLINDLAKRGDLRPPLLAFGPESGGGCSAIALLRWPGRSALLFDPGLLPSLDTPMLRALVAHELAHIRRGDPVRHEWLRLVARLLMLGDGFVAVIESSYRNEQRADAEAIAVFGADPNALATAIELLNELQALTWGRWATGLPIAGGTAPRLNQAESHVGLLGSVRARLAEWWMLYTGDTALGYWHPETRHRLAALRAMNGSHAQPEAR